MIDLKSNLDRLEDSASNFYKRGQNDDIASSDTSRDRQQNALQTASDLRGAIQDIQNLRDHVFILERNNNQMSCELNDKLNISSALLAAVEPALNQRMDERLKIALTDNIQLDALEARLETLEGFKDALEPDDISGLESYVDDRIDSASIDNDRDDETRDTVRDMIRDGDIVVSIDLS